MAVDLGIQKMYGSFIPAIDSMNCGLAVRDTKGTLTFVNERLLNWLLFKKEDLVGQPAVRLVPSELRDEQRKEMRAADDGDLRIRLSILQRKDSTTFPVLIIPQRLLDRRGRQIGAFGVFVDLGGIQTAKRVGPSRGHDLRRSLDRIGTELQALSLTADLSLLAAVPLEHPDFKALSGREREVLSHLLSGDRVPGIAKRLHLSPHTVRNHLKSIFRKVGVTTQSELIQRVRSVVAVPPENHTSQVDRPKVVR